jgi:hypothetical protein
LSGSAGKQRNGRGAVVGTIVAVDAGGAPEFRDQGQHGLAPGLAHVGLDRRDGAVERAQKVGEAAVHGAFVDVSVPAAEGERADARAFGRGKEFRGRPGRLGEIAAHLLDAAATLDRRSTRLGVGDAAGLGDGSDPKALLEPLREGRIGMPVEIEHAHRGLIANRRQARRRPGEDRGGTAHDQRGDRPDRERLPAARDRIRARLESRDLYFSPAKRMDSGLMSTPMTWICGLSTASW